MRTRSKTALMMGAVVATVLPAPTQAMQDDDAVDEIIVTGIRRSLSESIDTKRSSAQIVDAITAQDIGQLPDVTVAESLQRITGVQIERNLGEGSIVRVRGLPQNLFLVDGRNILPVRGQRDVGLDNFPSELFAGLEVYKTPTASQIEGALGATINLRTRRPFDLDEQLLSYQGQLVYSDLSEDVGYKLSALASKQFTDTFGGLITFALNDRKLRSDQFETTGYETAGDVNGDGIEDFKPDRLQFLIQERDRKRFGVSGSLQWLPVEGADFYLDGIYTRLEDEGSRALARFVVENDIVEGTTPVVSANNTILAGTFTNAGGETNASQYRGDGAFEPSTTEIFVAALGGTYERGLWSYGGEISFSESTQVRELDQFFLANAGTLLSYDFRDSDLPDITFDTDVTDPSGFTSPLTQRFLDDSESQETAVRFDVGYEWSDRTTTKFGSRYRDQSQVYDSFRTANRSIFDVNFGLTNLLTLNAQDNVFDGVSGNFPRRFIVTDVSDPTDLQRLLDLDAIGFEPVPGEVLPTQRVFDPSASNNINEETLAFYVQQDFDFDMGSIPVSGNVGIRHAETNLQSDGFLVPSEFSFTNANNFTDANDPSTPRPLSVSQSYSSTLPSANIQFELDDNLVLRLAAAEVIARPDPSLVRVGVRSGTPPSVEGQFGAASGGNPNLRPFEATQFDASVEYYIGTDGLLSAAYFYKDVSAFIVDQVTIETLPGFQSGFDQFEVTRPANGEDGSIEGIELAYVQPFDFLPTPLDGFGINANYTYADSNQGERQNPLTGESLPLENLSAHSYNLIGFYEQDDLSVRLAYNWRDDFLIRTSGRGGSPDFVDARGQLDLSAFYDLSDQLTLTFEATNLTDEPIEGFTGFDDRLNTFNVFDRLVSIGVRGRF